jgi:hypothetical protein
LEGMNRAVAAYAPAFQASLEVPPPAEEGPLLVVTADGKGVPMRRPPQDGPKPLHVLERLWAVAHCFHTEGSEGARQFVEERLRDLLQGRVSYVIAGLRRRLTRGKLSGPKRKVVKAAVEYLANNRGHMRYDDYSLAGPELPTIADGDRVGTPW